MTPNKFNSLQLPKEFCQLTGIRRDIQLYGYIYTYLGDNEKREQCYRYDEEKTLNARKGGTMNSIRNF